jgi:hypothetical protein
MFSKRNTNGVVENADLTAQRASDMLLEDFKEGDIEKLQNQSDARQQAARNDQAVAHRIITNEINLAQSALIVLVLSSFVDMYILSFDFIN